VLQNKRGINMTQKKILTVSDLAEELNHHPNTIRKLLISGDITSFKSAGDWRVLREDLDAYIQKQKG